jgi:hydroxylaminobenzene mutase
MGVSAHLEAILTGVFLVGLGLAWPRLRLTPRLLVVCFWAALIGAYANWAIPLFSATVGASQPILAGAGYQAAGWQEALLTVLSACCHRLYAAWPFCGVCVGVRKPPNKRLQLTATAAVCGGLGGCRRATG